MTMETFVLSFIVIGLAAVGMAAGLLLRGSALKGTCATLNELGSAQIDCATCPLRYWRTACKRRRNATDNMANHAERS